MSHYCMIPMHVTLWNGTKAIHYGMVVMHVTLWHYTNVCTLFHGTNACHTKNGTTYTNYGMHGIISVCHATYI